MSVLTIPVKLLKCTFWFSSLGICISYKHQLMLMWLVEPHTLRSKDLWYSFQNLPGHEGDLKCVCWNFRFSGSPSGPLTKPSPENGPGNQYFLVSVSETSHDQAGLKALTSDSRFRSYQLAMSSLSPLCLYWKFSTRAEENHLGSLRILLAKAKKQIDYIRTSEDGT